MLWAPAVLRQLPRAGRMRSVDELHVLGGMARVVCNEKPMNCLFVSGTFPFLG